MDIIEQIKNETDIEKLKELSLEHLSILYNGMQSQSHKAEIFEFILGNVNLAVSFEYCENPKVSIIIPVKNEFIMTSALLNSLKNNIHNIEYEIIIADDNSVDETQYIEKIFKNVRRIVNDTGHSGFIYNMNNAISKARGEYVFSMNNDMLTLPNFLNELLNIIENDKSIGIAGSKTLKIDYTVDECGANFYSDGNVWFIGEKEPENFEDDKPFIDCDYCSGCSILFRRDVWEKAGKFDINLAPAYYDDSDFAFNLRYNFGLKSVCVPKSKIFHFKGVSYTPCKELSKSFKNNRQYFLAKWSKYLER